MTKERTLKKEAVILCNFMGHEMKRFNHGKFLFFAGCRKCNEHVIVNPEWEFPKAVFGRAIRLTCVQ